MNFLIDNIPTFKKNSQGIKKVVVENKLRCSKCGYLLDVSNFNKDKSSASGFRSHCARCAKKYKMKRAIENNTSGIIGIYLEKCAYKGCQKNFTTKTPTKAFCSPKCRKRDWYEKNEQSKWKTSYKKSI